MSRRPAAITQTEIARIIRAAKQAGAASVEVKVDGHAVVVVRLQSTGQDSDVAPVEEFSL